MSAKLARLERAAPEIGHTVEMTVAEWLAVPDNPRQRDTERHLAKAKHLRALSPTHSRVAMAVSREGERWKLDGHTRALAWQRGMLSRPAKLVVAVFPVADEREAADLYTQFDAAESVETGADKVFGSYREIQFSPKSSLLKAGSVTTAVRIAEGLARGQRMPAREPIYGIMAQWRKEMQTLDGINPLKVRFTAPLIAAALLTFRRYGEEPVEFWTLYNDDAGQKFESAMDPVETLSRFVLQARAGGSAAAGTYDVVGKGLAAYEAHRNSKTYTRGFLALDATRYLKRA